MCRPPAYALAVLVFFSALTVETASASEIRMKNGEVYSKATVLHADAASIEIQVAYGTLTLPLDLVEQIDGVAVYVAPQETPRARPSRKEKAPAAQPTPARGAVPTAPSITAASPSGKKRAALPAPTTPARSPGPVASPAPLASAEEKPWQKIPWLPVAMGVLGVLWIVTAAQVWLDLRKRKADSRRWLYAAIALPLLGWLLYQLTRGVQQWWARRKMRGKFHHRFEFLDADRNPIFIQAVGMEITGIENAKEVLEGALRKRASDVHIEPAASEYRVRFRIDGMLQTETRFSPGDGLRLVSALKNLAQLDITERRKAQDGRFSGRLGKRDVDFRVATTPSVIAEKIVIRILDLKAGLRGLEDLGMNAQMMTQFEQVIHSRNGMIIATGPTGSGKTSTLYAALTQLDSQGLNLVTIEDPVEYELAGATQIPVNPRAGVTYESGLRSILRQDPDVILVGEMRDLEAGQIALRSALTGHLVFTSLHTKDAIGTIHRLEEMGIERHLVASALFVLMSQRLVRILCPYCRLPYPSVGNELAEISIEIPEGQTIYRPVGCRKCEGIGYSGRTGIFEMLIFDEDLRQGVLDGMSEDEFTRLAREKGYRGYREDGAEKILQGVTTVDEVLKAI
jgi:type II secretory ATPase GspE/PulE/Tfp pilus assembly ATPase PilB-like protein